MRRLDYILIAMCSLCIGLHAADMARPARTACRPSVVRPQTQRQSGRDRWIF